MRTARPPRLAWLLLALCAACPTSPGHRDPPTSSTPVAVGPYALVPRSTFTFDSHGLTVMVTDHPTACAEMSAVGQCQPAPRNYVEPPNSVRTALVFQLVDAVPGAAAAVGTYPVVAACSGPPAPFTLAAFVVRDPAGQVVALDPVVGGTVVVEEVQRGSWAAGTYHVILQSGASVSGDFAGPFCAAVSQSLALCPTCP